MKKKLQEVTVKLITKEVLSELNIKERVCGDDIERLMAYFYDLEIYYANGEEQNYYGIDSKALDDICSAVDDLNVQEGEVDLDDLNKRLGLE